MSQRRTEEELVEGPEKWSESKRRTESWGSWKWRVSACVFPFAGGGIARRGSRTKL